jgi:rod shape-determining protein MreD
MNIIGDILLYLLAGSVHWWWTARLSLFGLAPNIIFVTALSSAIIARPVKGICYGFFLGLYLDILGSHLFGGYALTYTLMAYGVYLMKRQLDLVSPFSQVVSALALTVVSLVFYHGLLLALAGINPLRLRTFLVEPFLNAALAPAAFYFLSRLKKRFNLL